MGLEAGGATDDGLYGGPWPVYPSLRSFLQRYVGDGVDACFAEISVLLLSFLSFVVACCF